MKRIFLVLGLSLGLALSGCGGSEAVVTGKITYKGKAVNSGTITFEGVEKSGSSFNIKEDGTYETTKLQPGKYKVSILTPTALPKPGPPGEKKSIKPPEQVQVDMKYGKAETSGLEYEVKAGRQEIDIELPKN